ncbi:MAG: sulfatase [Pirellulaceae bacterium]|nr:MAG: sulfatase [Pirellulaceae bacterium]GIW94029.1 MAG: sulfatase [Pirellulaceae bacterium]
MRPRANCDRPGWQAVAAQLTRRHYLMSAGYGIGLAALRWLLASEAQAAERNPLAPKPTHFPPRAKSCIFIFLEGAPSQLDLFDPKPKLNQHHGKPLPESLTKEVRFAFIKKETAVLMGSERKFTRHGQCGMEFSDLLPHLATCADDILMVRSMHTDQFNHHPAQLTLFCGRPFFGLPSVGAWLAWGLGTESQNLPAFVVLSAGRGTSGGASLWQSGFLPSMFAGVVFRNQGEPVLNLVNPPGIPAELQRKGLDALKQLNASRMEMLNDPEIESRIASYELAFRMQMAAPELIDLSDETQQTLDMYGVGRPDPPNSNRFRGYAPGHFHQFALNCLLARRLVERGVRFVQINHASWDHHSNLPPELAHNCQMADQPVAALLKDLKRRGLLDTTLVVWAGEFGRTPLGENRQGYARPTGRDHHPYAFTIWMAGGGVKGGTVYGETDELGWGVVRDPVHVNDFHATLLHLFGLNHLKLTHRFQGLDARLTGVGGRVIHEWLA